LEIEQGSYGLNDAPCIWYDDLTSRLKKQGWLPLAIDPCVYILLPPEQRLGKSFVTEDTVPMSILGAMCIHVDDLMVAAPDPDKLMTEINVTWKVKGPVREYLGTTTIRTKVPDKKGKATDVWWVGQPEYCQQLRQRAIADVQATDKFIASGPLPTCAHLRGRETEETGEDPEEVPLQEERPMATVKKNGQPLKSGLLTEYQSEVGRSSWVSVITRPDTAFCATLLGSYMQDPTTQALAWAKRAAAWLRATWNRGYVVPLAKHSEVELHAYMDASFGAKNNSYKSISGWVISMQLKDAPDFLVPISWKAGIQSIIARSSQSAEIIAASCATEKLAWVRHLFQAVGIPIKSATAHIDSDDVIHLVTKNRRMKTKEWSVGVQMARLRELVEEHGIHTEHIGGEVNPADELTKPKYSTLVPSMFMTSIPPQVLLQHLKSPPV